MRSVRRKPRNRLARIGLSELPVVLDPALWAGLALIVKQVHAVAVQEAALFPWPCVSGNIDFRRRIKRRPRAERTENGGEFTIKASCSLHRGAPLEHLVAMIQAVHDFGVYG